MQHKFAAKGACCRSVSFDLEDGRLHDVKFIGGCACSGNTRAISKLLEGADARWTADLLRGNECNLRSSSCTAQLAKAIDTMLAE